MTVDSVVFEVSVFHLLNDYYQLVASGRYCNGRHSSLNWHNGSPPIDSMRDTMSLSLFIE